LTSVGKIEYNIGSQLREKAKRRIKMKRVALALLLTLPLGAFATEEVIEEVVVVGNPHLLEEDKAYYKYYREMCDKHFIHGEYKNTVWIKGMLPGQYCHRYALALVKKDFDVS
jgi:hypothetical protein